MTWQEGISLFREILLLAATITGVVVAAMGLSTWKKQLKGSAEWGLARRFLRCVYEVRDAINAVRNPLMGGGEISSAKERYGQKNPSKTDDAEWDRGIVAAYQVRWERVRDARRALDVEVLEAEVLWGEDAKKSVDPLQRCAANLFSHLQIHLKPRGPGSSWEPTANRVVFGSNGPKDEYATELRSAIGAAEDFIRPKLFR